MKRPKPKVTWTDKTGINAKQVESNLPYYQRPQDIPRDIAEHMGRGPGALFTLKVGMYPAVDSGYAFAPLYPHYGPDGSAQIKKGSLVMYAGDIRASERKNGDVVQAVKHTFIISGGRYIIVDLSQLKPA